MTVSSSTAKAGPYAGAGLPGPFTVPFRFLAASHLQVIKTSTAGIDAVLTLTTDYTVAGVGAASGSVTLTAPLAAGERLTIVRNAPFTQLADYVNNDAFPAESHEDALDLLTMQTQQLKERSDAALTLPATVTGVDTDLPTPESNKLIGWNQAGDALQNFDATTLASIVAFGTSSADVFTGNGVQTQFALTANPGALANLDVAVGGVTQTPGVDYTFSGTTLTFISGAPALGAVILARFFQALPMGTSTAGDVSYSSATSYDPGTVGYRLNESKFVSAVAVPKNGVTSATAAIQALFDSAVISGATDIYFPDGTYLLTNPRNDAQASCAVVIRGLKRCRIFGGKSTKFIVGPGGVGASQFGMFRIEECEDLEFFNFEMDGSGITTTGAGANRSFSFVLANFDQNNQATNLAPNKRIKFRNLYIHDIGGGPSVLPRTASLPPAPMTEGLVVEDCEMKNLLNVNHGVGACFVRNLEVKNNEFWNDIATVTTIDNMAVDASRGCVNVTIENNWVRGFHYGMKSETQTNGGGSGTEVRESSRVRIVGNRLEEIGNPAALTSGGDNTFGIKVNSVDGEVTGNTVLARTVGVTGGGLYAGIIAVNTHNADSHCKVAGNRTKGAQYGILHNDTTPTTRECSVEIASNRFDDCAVFGASLQGNVEFDDNIILRAGMSAVEIQTANMTFVRRNRFIDCGTTDNPVIPEIVGGVYQSTNGAIGGYTEITDNIIVDTRGASAAEYGYFLRGATTFSNPLVFRAGYTVGLRTAIAYDSNFNPVGQTNMVGGINRPGPRRFLTTNSPAVIAPYNTLPWNVGDEAELYPPVVGSPKGWKCTVAGTPGTWVSLGNL
jgi:hypothetical protein